MNRTSVAHAYPAVRRETSYAIGFNDFIRALESILGKMNLEIFSEITTVSPERAREKLNSVLGVSSFALFQKIDHGAILKSLTGRNVRAMTYVFGNPLIATELTRHERMIGLYVPPRLFVTESEAGGTVVTYDVPSATFRQFESAAVDAVAASLDAKVEKLIDVAAALASKARARRPPSRFSADVGGRR